MLWAPGHPRAGKRQYLSALTRAGGDWLATIHNPAESAYASLRATAADSAHDTVTPNDRPRLCRRRDAASSLAIAGASTKPRHAREEILIEHIFDIVDV
jgi:hypothetical protein